MHPTRHALNQQRLTDPDVKIEIDKRRSAKSDLSVGLILLVIVVTLTAFGIGSFHHEHRRLPQSVGEAQSWTSAKLTWLMHKAKGL